MAKITLTLEVNDEERANLIARFIATAQAVIEDDEDGPGIPSDPNGSKIDKFGVVWDARFHGANMSKNQDGSWRRKKGLTDQEKLDADNYEAGCRGASTTATAAANVPTPVAPVAAPAPTADVPAFLQTGAFTPAPVAPPAMMMPGIPAPAPAPVTYPELIAAFQAAQAKFGDARLQSELPRIYAAAGITDPSHITFLETDESKRRIVKDELERLA